MGGPLPYFSFRGSINALNQLLLTVNIQKFEIAGIMFDLSFWLIIWVFSFFMFAPTPTSIRAMTMAAYYLKYSLFFFLCFPIIKIWYKFTINIINHTELFPSYRPSIQRLVNISFQFPSEFTEPSLSCCFLGSCQKSMEPIDALIVGIH